MKAYNLSYFLITERREGLRSVFEWMAGATAIVLITVFLIGMIWQREKIKQEKVSEVNLLL